MVTAIVARLLSTVLGTLYPAFASFQTLRDGRTQDVKRWMTYWICFAFFLVFEAFGDILLFWLPFYYEAKVILLLLLLAPTLNGPEFVYKTVIRPTLSTHEPAIERTFGMLKDTFVDRWSSTLSFLWSSAFSIFRSNSSSSSDSSSSSSTDEAPTPTPEAATASDGHARPHSTAAAHHGHHGHHHGAGKHTHHKKQF